MKTGPDWQFYRDNEAEPPHRLITMTNIILYLSIVNVLIILAAPVARLYLDTPGYLTFRIMLVAMLAGMLFGFIALMLLIISILWKLHGFSVAAVWILVAGFTPPVIALLMTGIDAIGRPIIHDISTDTGDPPEYQEVKNLRTPGDNSTDYPGEETARLQQQAYPDIRPIITNLNQDDALIEATQVVKDMQWEFVNLDYENGIIEAYDTSRIFGFIDDIIIRVRRDGRGSRVDLRSSSRVGKGDLGKNAERIRQYIGAFRS